MYRPNFTKMYFVVERVHPLEKKIINYKSAPEMFYFEKSSETFKTFICMNVFQEKRYKIIRVKIVRLVVPKEENLIYLYFYILIPINFLVHKVCIFIFIHIQTIFNVTKQGFKRLPILKIRENSFSE